MNKHTTAMASRSTKKGRVSHMKITPVQNGFTTETHYHPNENDKGMMMPGHDMETSVHTSVAGLKNHIGSTFAPSSTGEATQETSSPGMMDSDGMQVGS